MTPILLLIAGSAAIIFTLCVCCSRQPVPAAVANSRPSLTDEEFLARCRPGTRPEVALKVRKIVSEQLFIPVEQIYPEDRFVEDLGAD